MTPGAVSTHKHQPFINRGELGWIPDVITDGADEMCGARNDPEKPWLQRYYCTRGVPATTATTSPTGINSWMIATWPKETAPDNTGPYSAPNERTA